MRIGSTLLFLLLFGNLMPAQQTGTAEPPEDLKVLMREMASALQQTQGELRETRAEIRELRSEIEQLRTEKQQLQPVTNTIADKITTAEENQQILDSRVDQLQQVKLESASKRRVKIDGMILFNAGFNRGEVDSIDVPNLALSPVPGQHEGSVFGTLRQSLIGLQVFGPRIGGARTSAELHFDFFGGFPNELDSSAMGLLRLRVGLAHFDWENWSIRVGQDQPLMTPYSPTSLAAVGTPSFGYSGNLWTWTPQIVGERRWRTGEYAQARLEFGIMDPFDGESPPDQFERAAEAGERSRLPAFAVRQSWKIGSPSHMAEFGVGGYMEQQDYGFNRVVHAWAGNVDWNVPLASKVAASGSFFRGRGLGGLWGGIGASATFNGLPTISTSAVRGVNAIGGWSQLKYSPVNRLEFNGVYGMDNPFAADVHFSEDPSNKPALRNQTAMLNAIGHLRSNVLVSVEYRHLRTTLFDSSVHTAEHVNLALGVQF
jgi:hypothetical protein